MDARPDPRRTWTVPAAALLLVSGGLCEAQLVNWWARSAPFLWPDWTPYPGVALGHGSYEAAVAIASLLVVPTLLLPALGGLLRQRPWSWPLALGWGAGAGLSHAAAVGVGSLSLERLLFLAPSLLLATLGVACLRRRLGRELSKPRGGTATAALLTVPALVVASVAPELWRLHSARGFDYSLFRWAALAVGGVILGGAWLRARLGRGAALLPLLVGAGGALGVAAGACARQASWGDGRAFGVGLQAALIALAGLLPLAVALRPDRQAEPAGAPEPPPATGPGAWIGLGLLLLAGAGLGAWAFGSTTSWPAGAVLSLPGDGLDPSTPVLLSGGRRHTCAARVDGPLLCWGDNGSGQLGRGERSDEGGPQRVPGLDAVTGLSCGSQHCCAVRADQTLWCWGDNRRGQLGDGTTTQRPTPVQVAGLTEVGSVAAADEHTFAVLRDGTVRAWGDNGLKLLGTGLGTPTVSRPKPVLGLRDVVALTSSARQRCALDHGGIVRCWGPTHVGRQADGSSAALWRTPTVVQRLPTPSSVGAGAGFACALDAAGTLRCWGAKWCPQPVVLALPVAAQALAVSSEVCVLSTGGEVWCVDGRRRRAARRLYDLPPAVALTVGRGICVATAGRAVFCSLARR